MELIDLYDADRVVLGRKAEKEAKMNKGEYRVVVHVCVLNSKGEMLIQQRSSTKKNFPNTWDLTLGGNVQAGENARMAAQRELMEELGIDVDFSDIRPLYTFNFKDGFDDMFVFEKDINIEDVKFIDGEVQAVKWATREEILKLIEQKQFIKYYSSVINLIFDTYKSKNAFNV